VLLQRRHHPGLAIPAGGHDGRRGVAIEPLQQRAQLLLAPGQGVAAQVAHHGHAPGLAGLRADGLRAASEAGAANYAQLPLCNNA
jgi:hypothetical protein